MFVVWCEDILHNKIQMEKHSPYVIYSSIIHYNLLYLNPKAYEKFLLYHVTSTWFGSVNSPAVEIFHSRCDWLIVLATLST